MTDKNTVVIIEMNLSTSSYDILEQT